MSKADDLRKRRQARSRAAIDPDADDTGTTSAQQEEPDPADEIAHAEPTVISAQSAVSDSVSPIAELPTQSREPSDVSTANATTTSQSASTNGTSHQDHDSAGDLGALPPLFEAGATPGEQTSTPRPIDALAPAALPPANTASVPQPPAPQPITPATQQTPPPSAIVSNGDREPRKPKRERKPAEPAARLETPPPPQEITDVGEVSWARSALLASWESATMRTVSGWVRGPVTINQQEKERIAQRLLAERRRNRSIKIAETHIVNAAFKTRPKKIDELIKLADEYMRRIGPGSYKVKGTTGSLEPDVADEIDLVGLEVRATVGFGYFGKVQSALVCRFLDRLDAEDALATPRSDLIDLDRL